MAIDLEAARLLIYRAAANAEGDQPSRLGISLAKIKANKSGQ
jgi:alkylation response protein AidB-like acyl-CoA dehydrogenase